MKEKRNTEPTFIPCGDSVEKMEEIKDEQLENISGGEGNSFSYRTCPYCGRELLYRVIRRPMIVTDYMCERCGHLELNPWE